MGYEGISKISMSGVIYVFFSSIVYGYQYCCFIWQIGCKFTENNVFFRKFRDLSFKFLIKRLSWAQ